MPLIRWLDRTEWGLYKRIAFPMIFLLIIGGTTRSVLLANEEAEEARLRTRTTLASLTQALTPIIASHVANGDYAAIKQLMQQEVSDYAELARLEWHYGITIIIANKPEPGRDSGQPYSSSAWFSDLVGIHAMRHDAVLAYGDKNYGSLTLQSNPATALYKIWHRLQSQIITVLVVISVLSVLLALLLHSSLAGLRALAASMQRFHNNHSERASESGPAEIKRLGRSFNQMAEEIAKLLAHLQSSQDALHAEKLRAEITLMSIGDGVLTTDAQGNITMLNPVAENLTGWSTQEAAGLPLEKVFHIINKETMQRVANPVAQVLEKGIVVGLGDHSQLISRDGRECSIEDSAAPIRSQDGALIGCILVFHDVTEKHKLLDRVSWQAGHDALTGLPNRALLRDRLHQSIAQAERNQRLLAVCFLDLDQFKPINDRYGHDVGDKLLIEASQRMNHELRGADTLARLGGDEFVLLLTELQDVSEIRMILERILKSIAAPYLLDGMKLEISTSIGVSIYPTDNVDPDLLLRHADNAMYQAKQDGRNRFHVFDAASDQETLTRAHDIQSIREALVNQEFRLYYQPKVNMRRGQVIGLEALIRWQHPVRGLLSPIEFLPLVEQTDLIADIGLWVLDEAMRQIEQWQLQGGGWPVSVNQAARDFMHPLFIDRLRKTLDKHPAVPRNWIELEILETAAIEDLKRVSEIITECHKLGVTFALDDFGTGYSSLSYLKGLPADCLKIDQSFVRDMLDDKGDMALVEGVISLAQVFQLSVIAEGVESPEHGVLLLRLGCDNAQGYGIARPMPGDAVAAWVSNFKPHHSWSLWADTQWELMDFPLLVAQHDHLRWVKSVLATLGGDELKLSAGELKDHHQCRLGQWYYSHGKQRYGQMETFIKLEAVHTQVHQVGQEIIRLRDAGEMDSARTAAERLLVLKDQILNMLAKLQQEVAKLHNVNSPVQNAYEDRH